MQKYIKNVKKQRKCKKMFGSLQKNPYLCRKIRKMKENTHNGFEYVDLGLPSGLKWATCNVGATSEEQYGKYFQWGDTVGYEGDDAKAHSSWETTPFNNGSTSYNKKAILINKLRILNDNGVLRKAFDAAHVHMGGNWRMPTREEFIELRQHTTSRFIRNYNNSGINGRLFTSKGNNNSMFVPASGVFSVGEFFGVGSYGYLWSSSLDVDGPFDAWGMLFDSDYLGVYDDYRYGSLPVRGVLAQDSQFIEDDNQEDE